MKRLMSLFALLLSLFAVSAWADTCTAITPQTDFFAGATHNQITLSGQSCFNSNFTVMSWNGTLVYKNFAPAQVPGFVLNGTDTFALNFNFQTNVISVNYNGTMTAVYAGQTYNASFNNVQFTLTVNPATGAIAASNASGTVTVNGVTVPVTNQFFGLLL